MEKDRSYKYYNNDEFQKILKLMNESKYQQAIVAHRNYIEKYPYDMQAITSLCNLLMQFGDIEEAEEVLSNFIITKNTKDMNITQYIYIKIKILACQEKWEECYQLLKENLVRLQNYRGDFNFIILYLEKKLNVSFEIDIPNYTYTMEQVLQYDEKKVLEHISKHIDQEESCVFFDNFPLENYYFYFRNILPLENYPRLYSGIFHNQYIFKYENCGHVDGKNVNYILVITLQNSNDIITIYPFDNKENFPYIDITPKVEEIDIRKTKIKRLSQIEKFNQRYGKSIDNN